jgi:putative hemolysin
MQAIESRIIERYPHWFRGVRRHLTRPLLAGFKRYTRLDRIEAFLAGHPHLEGLCFVEGVLRFLDVRYRVDDLERQRIPERGACLIVANHPLGGLDGLALLKLVGDIRPDVRIVANEWLGLLEPLRSLLLPVRVFGGHSETAQLAAIDEALAQGCAVIMFPAAEVARMGMTGLAERRWKHGFLRYAAQHEAPVVPVQVRARNSLGFYAGAAVAGPVGTALLPREIFTAGRRRVDLHIGRPWVPPAEAADAAARPRLAQRFRAAVLGLHRGRDLLPTRPEAIAHPRPRAELLAAIAHLDVLGETSDGKRILLAGPEAPACIRREIARLRELSFRAVGEGTGQALDWDRFDAWYEQLVLWDESAGRIVGGYRVARTAPIVAERGLAGLYTATLFRFDQRFDEILAAGLELGRSFVIPDYWGTRSLDYLWFGIGAYLRRHPELRHLFGTVSISAEVPPAARDRLVAHYRRHHGGETGLADPIHPYPVVPLPADEDGSDAAMRRLREELARMGARIPTLYKQYVELCEPGGARFLAFGIDPDFADAVDGLILVDLNRITPRKRERYIGSRSDPAALESAHAQAA